MVSVGLCVWGMGRVAPRNTKRDAADEPYRYHSHVVGVASVGHDGRCGPAWQTEAIQPA